MLLILKEDDPTIKITGAPQELQKDGQHSQQ
jgi:hypothetical protein